ncbi:Holliday junction branch migration protein RuvA [Subtercola boreus]|uniref:Holliday junction branch migration complex subunit RuvA n=1 Tax=Subtercola boreus TaxID=120213 RepID=A0A3E0WD96_9MICO|nr:Holliday junction branch migration protein RuvA [Subtercola boreus]RFA21326.1 Holliday junction branch migration protein RuvA [Subtercola boreus]RFA21709.1 Holliday junction branch migration protein RuvA [Subtercola boreus]RFA27678.1 Holliday junction branch migration protein RuvA [Subtercola boreus]
MISSLRGTVLAAVGSAVVIEVSGVGYSVQVTPAHALSLRVGQEAFVVTTLIVREDALSLFGFEGADSLEIFSLLVGVTGVGPKSALGVLAALTPSEIAQAVTRDDDSVFRRVTGIGPKTAKLIVVSLTGKVAGFSAGTAAGRVPSFTGQTSIRDDVLVALVGLGWNDRSASEALDRVLLTASDDVDTMSVQSLLRLALSELGPRQGSAGPR